MGKIKKAALTIVALPPLVFGMLALALLGLVGAVGCLRVGRHGAYAIDATWRPWVARWWRYSTTIGLSVIYHPSHVDLEELRRHEAVHVRQHQDHGILGALLGVLVAPWSWEGGLLVWALSPAYSAPCWLGAWLRGGHPYRDAEHERSAYGQVSAGEDLRARA